MSVALAFNAGFVIGHQPEISRAKRDQPRILDVEASPRISRSICDLHPGFGEYEWWFDIIDMIWKLMMISKPIKPSSKHWPLIGPQNEGENAENIGCRFANWLQRGLKQWHLHPNASQMHSSQQTSTAVDGLRSSGSAYWYIDVDYQIILYWCIVYRIHAMRNLGTKPFKILKSSSTATLPIDSTHQIINLHCHGTNPNIKGIDIAWYSTILHHFPLDPQKHRGSVPSNGDGQIDETLRRWCRLPGRQPPGMLVVGLVSWIKTQTILATQPNPDCNTDTDAERFLDRRTPTWIVMIHDAYIHCKLRGSESYKFAYLLLVLLQRNVVGVFKSPSPQHDFCASLSCFTEAWQNGLATHIAIVKPLAYVLLYLLFITYHINTWNLSFIMSQWDGDEIWSMICIFVRVRVGISSTNLMLRENLCLADPRYPSRSRATMLYMKSTEMVRAAKMQSKLQLPVWGVRFLRFHVLCSIVNSLQSIAVQSWTLLECSSSTSIIHYNSEFLYIEVSRQTYAEFVGLEHINVSLQLIHRCCLLLSRSTARSQNNRSRVSDQSVSTIDSRTTDLL